MMEVHQQLINKIKAWARVYALASLVATTTACSSVLETPDLTGPDFTNQQAVSKMEETIKAHAALQNTTPGPIQTVCNFDDGDGDAEVYHCSTYVKESSVVLYADCAVDGCKATGYDQVEKSDE